MDGRIMLIDLDACAEMDVGFAGVKYSSAYLPPEMIHKSDKGNNVCVRTYEASSHNRKQRKSGFQFRASNHKEYTPVLAVAAHDIWVSCLKSTYIVLVNQAIDPRGLFYDEGVALFALSSTFFMPFQFMQCICVLSIFLKASVF
jgi:hypothetical protein